MEKELTHFFNTSLTTGLGKLKTDSNFFIYTFFSSKDQSAMLNITLYF